MKTIAPVLLVATLLGAPAIAQQKPDDHSGHHAAGAAAATAGAADMADGEVRKVDRDAGKLTLKHGEIRNLDMPGMTMVFQVKEPALIDKVKVGDKVKFKAEKAAGGYVVTAIEAVK